MPKQTKQDSPGPEWRWRNVVLRILAYMNSNVALQLRLTLDQMSQQSEKSQPRSNVHLNWTPEQRACLHPSSSHLKGGNQHGSWTKCRLCGARLQYQKKGTSSSKTIEATTSSDAGSATASSSSTLPNHSQQPPLGAYTSSPTVPDTQP